MLPKNVYNFKTFLFLCQAFFQKLFGAGSGNRTHLSSLEGWSITDIRYPHILFFNLERLIGRGDRDRTCDLMVPNHARSHLRHTPIIILYSFILPHLSATKIILHDDFKSVNTFFKFFLFFLFYTSFMYKIGSLSSIKSIYPSVLLGLLIPKETLPGFINIIPSHSSIIGICE